MAGHSSPLRFPFLAFLTRVGHFFSPPPPEPRREVVLPQPHTFLLRNEMDGQQYPVTCLTARLEDALGGIRTHGLTDVCRGALVAGLRMHPERAAEYGFWTLSKVEREP